LEQFACVEELGTGVPRKAEEELRSTSECCAPRAGEFGPMVTVSVWVPLPTTTPMFATESPPSDCAAAAGLVPVINSAPDATAPATKALRITANLERDACDITVVLPTPYLRRLSVPPQFIRRKRSAAVRP
jgi:hypothetical protein